MYHGGIGGGGGAGNNIMSFSGRSGAELKYDNGAGSMNLKDQGGANMFFDGAGNVVHNANNDSTKTVGNNKTDKIGNNKKLEVGCDHIADVGGKHKVEVGQGKSVLTMDNNGVIDLTGIDKITLKVGSSEIIITGTKISITSSEVDIKAGNATANFKGDTKITGGKVDIN